MIKNRRLSDYIVFFRRSETALTKKEDEEMIQIVIMLANAFL